MSLSNAALSRNSLKYVPTRDYKDFPAHFEFEHFCQVWTKYPGAKAVWKRCFAYVEQLFDYPSIKLLYLRVVELQKKWLDRPVANWSLVRNQLLLNDRLAALFDKFDR